MHTETAGVRRADGAAQGTAAMVVVTGGSEGIGLAIAREYARRGRVVVLVARGAAGLEIAAATIAREHTAARIETLALDVGAHAAAERLEAFVASIGGHVDVLVNNAGIGHCGAFADIDPGRLEELIAVDIAAPLRLMRQVLPGMRRRGRGGIINIASLGGFVPGPWQAAYYASKAQLVSASRAIAAEVRRDGVRVTVVAPGPVDTEFHARMGAELALYRRLLPAASPGAVARWAVRGHEAGLRLVLPGFLTLLGFAACRLLPHALLVPIISMLLHPRIARPGADENA